MFEIFSGIKELTIIFSDDKLIYANEAAQYYYNSYIYTLEGADISGFFDRKSLEEISGKLNKKEEFVSRLTLYGGEEKVFTVRFLKDDFGRDAVAFFESDQREKLSKSILKASASPESMYDPLQVGKGEIYINDIRKIAEAISESIAFLYDSAVIRRNRSLCNEVEKMSGNFEFLVSRVQKYIRELSAPESDLVIARSVFTLNDMLDKLVKRTDNYIKIENLDISLKYTQRESDIRISGAYFNLLKAVAGLLHNAIEYVLASGRRGRISLSLKTEGNYAVIEISDNGIGLSEKTFDLINNEEKDISGLSGDDKSSVLNYEVISLYIRMNNGSLILENRKDKGSVARVKLPLISESYSSLRFVSEPFDAETEIDTILREGIVHI